MTAHIHDTMQLLCYCVIRLAALAEPLAHRGREGGPEMLKSDDINQAKPSAVKNGFGSIAHTYS